MSIASVPALLGGAVWALFTSVRFAVAQIAVIITAGLIGIIVHQVPAYALGPNASPADYANEIAKLHAQYDPALGVAVANLFQRLGFFQVFSTPWFAGLLALLFLSILVCTLDRFPRLWRDVRHVRVVQPEAYFDRRLPGRARFEAGAWGEPAAMAASRGRTASAARDDGTPVDLDDVSGTIRSVLRRAHFRVRTEASGDAVYLYGDRNQYTKLATFVTHLGLLLFILGGVLTAYGVPFLGLVPASIPIVLAQDQTQTIQPIGTPNLLVVKNLGFSAPRDPSGMALDFTTDLAIYRNGVQVARKTIRVNDPLSYAGFTFHQNFTGPAVNLTLRDNAGNPLWTGPLPLDDAPVAGHAYKQFVVPGRAVSLDLLLFSQSGQNVLVVTGNRQTGVDASGRPTFQQAFVSILRPGDHLDESADGFNLAFSSVTSYTGLIARSDPGEYVVWFAFGCLLFGLLITFYLPRRRVWLRLERSGELAIVGRSDRYVAFEREFGRLLEDLSAARRRPRRETSVGRPAAVEPAG